jgi:hypothetical protein
MSSFRFLRVQLFQQLDSKLLTKRLQLIQILLILSLVLDLLLDT